jgi:hypothetical protein
MGHKKGPHMMQAYDFDEGNVVGRQGVTPDAVSGRFLLVCVV